MTTKHVLTPVRLTPEQDEVALRVLNAVDKLAGCYDGMQSMKRDHPRAEFRRKVWVRFRAVTSTDSQEPKEFVIEPWSRNLGRGGAAVLFPAELNFTRGEICLNPDAESLQWRSFVVAKVRQVLYDFWEYGLKFEGTGDS